MDQGADAWGISALEPIRLRTLVLLRWVAVAGQLGAVLSAQLLGVQFALLPVLVVIAASAVVNAVLARGGRRVGERGAALQLGFDLAQLTLLTALTGGLSNPFAMLIIAPATIAAAALDSRKVLVLASLTVAMITAAGLLSVPLTMRDGSLLIVPQLLAIGHWVALVVAVAFVSAYTHRVANELRQTALALGATQLALAREQRLQHLGGVVAAAAHEMGTPLATIKLIAGELADDLLDRPELAEDVGLLRDSVDRCSEILRSMGKAGRDDLLLRHAPLAAVLAEAAAPHDQRGKIAMDLAPAVPGLSEPVLNRDPGIVHALRNIIQNAVDFATDQVTVIARWDAEDLHLTIRDDGPGYPASILGRIGDPFLTARRAPSARNGGAEGMGLGLFIARSLLERSGAQISFQNVVAGGAEVHIKWPRSRSDVASRAVIGINPLISS